VLAPVVLAALFAPVCHGQLAPPTPVEQAMRYRNLFGLPAERAYVRRVQRSDARRDDQGFAFSARADHEAYFQARYGPAVTTFATAEATQLACTKLRRVRASSTGRSLRRGRRTRASSSAARSATAGWSTPPPGASSRPARAP
jgi:hypothetical protein